LDEKQIITLVQSLECLLIVTDVLREDFTSAEVFFFDESERILKRVSLSSADFYTRESFGALPMDAEKS
jgi:hypothetical protein